MLGFTMITKNACYGLVLACLLPLGVCAQDDGKARVEVLARTGVSWDGEALPPYPDGTPEVAILRITIPPHTSLPEHKHPVINAGVLLKGTLLVVAEDGRTLRLQAGDAIVELVDKWHHGTNDGDTPAEILVFYAGVEGTPVTVTQPTR